MVLPRPNCYLIIIKMNHEITLKKLLKAAEDESIACILFSNGFDDRYGDFEIMAGLGSLKECLTPAEIPTDELCFGFITYDFKNQIEHLKSGNKSLFDLPDFLFFKPKNWFLHSRKGEINTSINLDSLDAYSVPHSAPLASNWMPTSTKEEYVTAVQNIKESIVNGDYYELNFCTEWIANTTDDFNPYISFIQLCDQSPAPFSAFIKYHDYFLICSSPERFLKRKGQHLISEPIKGTRKRLNDRHADAEMRTELMTSEKDRAENIMITDLVRNDLSKVCMPGTVEVVELCEIKSYSHVHQMVSTITGELEGNPSFEEILHATFPMGSMTGAPKIKVMEAIDEIENFKRGLYSGSVGYCNKNEFDLNVVIRSIQYDKKDSVLAYHVGGAITHDSIPEMEFEECKTKAAGMIAALA